LPHDGVNRTEITLPDADTPGRDAHDEHLRGDASRPVTISVIAESAGVSIPTVSKVINGRAGVSRGTRARVEAVIDRYGYRRPAAATRAKIMELVFRELESVWAVEIIRGVERTARKHRIRVVVSEFGLHEEADPAWVRDSAAHHPACIISVAQLSAAEREELRARGIPFVIFDPTTEPPDDVPFVGATNWTAGQSAVRHSDRAWTPPDCHDQRPRPHSLLPRQVGRVPVQPWRLPGCLTTLTSWSPPST
jgi:hypothetical protein